MLGWWELKSMYITPFLLLNQFKHLTFFNTQRPIKVTLFLVWPRTKQAGMQSAYGSVTASKASQSDSREMQYSCITLHMLYTNHAELKLPN